MFVSPVCKGLPADVASALRCGYMEQLLLLGVLLSCSSVLVSGLDAAQLSSHTLELLCSVSVHKATSGTPPPPPHPASVDVERAKVKGYHPQRHMVAI